MAPTAKAVDCPIQILGDTTCNSRSLSLLPPVALPLVSGSAGFSSGRLRPLSFIKKHSPRHAPMIGTQTMKTVLEAVIYESNTSSLSTADSALRSGTRNIDPKISALKVPERGVESVPSVLLSVFENTVEDSARPNDPPKDLRKFRTL